MVSLVMNNMKIDIQLSLDTDSPHSIKQADLDILSPLYQDRISYDLDTQEI